MMMQKTLFFVGFRARGALGGLKLDEIDATNSFLMLPMARYSLKWPFKAHFIMIFDMIFHMIFHMIPPDIGYWGLPGASWRPRRA